MVHLCMVRNMILSYLMYFLLYETNIFILKRQIVFLLCHIQFCNFWYVTVVGGLVNGLNRKLKIDDKTRISEKIYVIWVGWRKFPLQKQ